MATTMAAPMQYNPPLVQSPYLPMMPIPTVLQPGVRRLKHRHPVFQMGVVGLVLGAVVFIAGFAVPAWIKNEGLWMSCFGEKGYCISNVAGGPQWLDAVRSMEVLALVCIILSVAVELYQDVFTSPPSPENRMVEILAVAAGLFGVIGFIVYGAELDKMVKLDGTDNRNLRWGFGLAVGGLSLCILSSLPIGYSRVKHAPLTNQALANLGVYALPCTAAHSFPMQPVTMGYGYPAPPSPYPHPSGPVVMAPVPAPAQGMPASPIVAAQGVSASQVPSCFVTVQGQMVPVYKEASLPVTNTS